MPWTRCSKVIRRQRNPMNVLALKSLPLFGQFSTSIWRSILYIRKVIDVPHLLNTGHWQDKLLHAAYPCATVLFVLPQMLLKHQPTEDKTERNHVTFHQKHFNRLKRLSVTIRHAEIFENQSLICSNLYVYRRICVYTYVFLYVCTTFAHIIVRCVIGREGVRVIYNLFIN